MDPFKNVTHVWWTHVTATTQIIPKIQNESRGNHTGNLACEHIPVLLCVALCYTRYLFSSNSDNPFNRHVLADLLTHARVTDRPSRHRTEPHPFLRLHADSPGPTPHSTPTHCMSTWRVTCTGIVDELLYCKHCQLTTPFTVCFQLVMGEYQHYHLHVCIVIL